MYGFSPEWVLMWCFRSPDRVKDFWHSWHLNGFSPVWVLVCISKLPDWANDFWHSWHLNGFSPVWVVMCLFKPTFRANDLWHSLHLYGFSPVWVLVCFFRTPCWANDLWHRWHLYSFFPKWVLVSSIATTTTTSVYRNFVYYCIPASSTAINPTSVSANHYFNQFQLLFTLWFLFINLTSTSNIDNSTYTVSKHCGITIQFVLSAKHVYFHQSRALLIRKNFLH